MNVQWVRASAAVAAFVVSYAAASLPAIAQSQQPPRTAPAAAVPRAPTAAPGRIVGRVIDQSTGLGITDAGIGIIGTAVGSQTGLDGRFILQNVPAGRVTLSVRRIGYQAKNVDSVVVQSGKVVEQNVSLSIAVTQVAAVAVTATVERGSVAAALDEQRTATAIVNTVTQEQITKSPDGDAAQAVQRASGVTVQDGKYVNARGLGDRYTTASLNGARIPSPEPERKVVPLDLFPSGLIQSVTTSKTFTPDQPGDFSGASVNIQTREFPAQRVTSFSSSFGVSDAVLGRRLVMPPMVGGDLFALGGGNRALPGIVATAGRFDPSPSPEDINRIVGAFRNSWQGQDRKGAGNGSLGLSVGGSDPVWGHTFGYLASGTYSYSQETRRDLRRALALPGGDGSAEEVDRYDGEFGRSSVLWGGLVNLSTMLGRTARVTLNNTYNRTMDSDARVESGYSQNLQTPLDITRLRYVERSVHSSQLAVTHELNDRHRFDYAVTMSGVTRQEPDRSEIVYERAESDPTPRWFSASNEGAVRTFGDLVENAREAKVDYRWTFKTGTAPKSIKVGAFVRGVERDAINRAYSIAGTSLTPTDRELSPEQIFDGRFSSTSDRIFRVTPLFAGGSYRANDRLTAGYAMADIAVTSRVSVIAGARLEQSQVEVESEPTVGASSIAKPEFTDVLPSLALTFKLADYQNLRLAASQTLARPEYRELSPVQYREVIGFDNMMGNENLVRTRVQNYDIRWEWYPTAEEVFSVSLFGKRFQDPIERVYLGTSGTRVITFQNAKAANNYGVELEVRKQLGSIADVLYPLTFSSNVTLMHSEIELNTAQASVTSANRPMVGQAPHVVNVGLTYTSESGNVSATVLFNTVGKRILDAGEAPLPDVIEQPRNVVDFSFRAPLFQNVGLRIDAKNLLDALYEYTQGAVVREFYRAGRTLTVGLSWKN